MKSVKLIVAYPQPKDAAAFEKIYQQEHVPMAIANLGREDQNRCHEDLAIAARRTAVLSYCGGSFSIHGGAPDSARSLPEARKPWPMRRRYRRVGLPSS